MIEQGIEKGGSQALVPLSHNVPLYEWDHTASTDQLGPLELLDFSDESQRCRVTRGNISLIFEQPLTETENPQQSAQLYLKAGDDVVGEILLSSPSDEVQSRVIEEAMRLADDGREISEFELQAFLVRLEQAGAKLASNLGDDSKSIAKGYHQALHPAPMLALAPPKGCREMHIMHIEGGKASETGDLSRIERTAGQDASHAMKWIDLEGCDSETMQKLKTEYGLPDEVIQDCLQYDDHTRVESYPANGIWFVRMHQLEADPRNPAALKFHEIHLCVGEDFLMVAHEDSNDLLAKLREELVETSNGQLPGNGQTLFYEVLRRITVSNRKVVNGLAEQVSKLYERSKKNDLTEPDMRQTMPDLSISLDRVTRLQAPLRELPSHLDVWGEQDMETAVHRQRWNTLHRQLFEDLHAASHQLETVDDTQLRLEDRRRGINSSHISTLLAIFTPQVFLTGFFGQNNLTGLWTEPNTMWVAHALALGLSGVLLWVAKKKKVI